MASNNKKKKLKNSYCTPGALKEKDLKIKRILFFTPSARKKIKADTRKELENE